MKFLLLFIVITSVLGFIGSFLTSTVKVDTSFYCSSGDIDLDTHSERVKTELGTRLKLKEVNVKGIDGMKCYGKVKAELPLIFALFMQDKMNRKKQFLKNNIKNCKKEMQKAKYPELIRKRLNDYEEELRKMDNQLSLKGLRDGG